MKYYKVLDINDNIIGFITSLDFRYYNSKNKRILCCDEKAAQYVYLNNMLFRINSLLTENEEARNKYNIVMANSVKLAEEKEYREFQKKNN